MAKKENEDILDDLDVNESISKAEGFVQENKKSISIIATAIVVIIVGYFGYMNLIVKPQEQNAQSEMFMAQYYFEQDSVDKAINGDGQFPGFIEIIYPYGSPQSANLSHLRFITIGEPCTLLPGHVLHEERPVGRCHRKPQEL